MKNRKGLKKILHAIYETITWIFALSVFMVGVFTFMEVVFKDPSLNPLGINFYVVASDSMASVDESNEQALKNVRAGFIQVNDVVAVKRISKPNEIEVGDIVTYLDDNGNMIIHRVSKVYEYGGKKHFMLRGDANNVDDPVILGESSLKGYFLFRIPMIGEIVRYVQSPYGIVALLIIFLIEFALKNELKREKLKEMPLLKR